MVDQVKQEVTRFRTINVSAQIKQAWGPEYAKADTGYVFANGRRFDNTDRSENGIYKNS